LSILSETYSNVLFIISLETLELESVLIMQDDIKSISWNPNNDICIFSTGNKRLYIYASEEASVCDIPEFRQDLFAHKVKWNEVGDSLFVSDQLNGELVYPQIE